MAIAHFSASIVSRGSGRSVVLSAAYRHCAKMEYEREARTIDYTRKQGLVHEEFMLPADAPKWVRAMIADRSVAGASEAFWNKVEAFEKRADAQLARDLTIALPLELPAEQNIALVRDFVEKHILAKGMVADWVYHDNPGNPHIHLMTTLRPLTGDGFGTKKVAVIGEDGQPVRTKSGKILYELWAGSTDDFNVLRDGWFERLNHHLALGGIDLRIDGRSYEKQGIDLEPTIHLGVGAKAIERKAKEQGIRPELERIELNEDRRSENARRILRRPEIVLDLITREKSVFDERDVAKVLHRYVDDPALFQQLMLRIILNPEVLRLQRDTIEFATGEKVPARYSTRAMIRLEATMARQAMWLSDKETHAVSTAVLAATFGRHGRLSEEQKAAIECIAGPARIAAVVGRAGAGKTTMMKAAREAWELAGYRVVGGALAGKAAEGLEKEAGIHSRTLASWELRWNRGRDVLDRKTVFVMDEAGMVASKQMARFVDTAVRAGAKIVLVGDPEQLQPIEAGAAFRAIVDRIGYAELETIYRQREDWMRKASLDLARGNVEKALTAYDANVRITGTRLKAEAVERLIGDWNHDYDQTKTTLILAHLRRDVRMLNVMAREKFVERGVVGEGHVFKTADGIRQFDAGDQIVFLKNETSLGVKNGMIAHVVEAAPNRIVAVVGEGDKRRQVIVEQRFYSNLDHGYATTIHKSQGATVDRVKVLASLSLDRHLTYVAMTRHREDVQLYYGRRSFAFNGGLAKVLSRKNAKETTLDYERGKLYREALRFAEGRGLNIVQVARTLVRDRLDWTLRQKMKLVELGQRLAVFAEHLGLHHPLKTQTMKEAAPMVAGIKTFSGSVADTLSDRLGADPALKQQWEEVSARFAYVFADPETAFRAMNFDAVLADKDSARQALQKLEAEPTSIGALTGKTGILASKTEREARRIAELNVPALKRDLEQYLRMRETASQRLQADEQALRQRVSIDIPALSPAACVVLERVRDAIDRNDLPAALGYALSNRETKLEIDGFNKAVTERFGERTLLTNAARQPSGTLFDKLSNGMQPAQKEQLREAWPVMRTAQQIAAHERTTQTLKQAEELRLTQRQSPVMKQ
ncbi:Ti-type conjugative transfer relaxase TraA (plasmid) [Agrobacterium tumefaciens]|uniref:Ti-type conjugative transfer relaxase TraA n=1 Tax=Rhizobium/Agrobacterium group TaxID=227290 RepID=UPI001572B833|nr:MULTISPECIES: Ti-type conjugative transfer relaxase TraA [Rhizobium/Agrobacterium group]NTA45631.1 Ti-type conjugative transfer relaxase TraA [Agrobacterium tumefaciens]NTI45962.1 Ti-type conjugative transfer relaxase TraA [Rhizobium rhizogenes]UXR95440.1 Ti-type conjugative transfer relaxase TraA [Agrobacterium tumefaciens]UXS66716.1 Ti-type conjugative transfer relaxase TraA [Agrobacterium tumefaciens]UXS74369.1 Ti-type conjugative transfer relaxase TraA [Agrobacterium tumefaciens]